MPAPTKLIVYPDLAGKWRWRAKAGNNRTVGASEQGYKFRWYAKRKARKAYPHGVFVTEAP